jgi:hypothetical protein
MAARLHTLLQAALVAMLALAVAAPIASAAGTPVASDPLYSAFVPSELASVQAETEGTLPRYRLNADFTPATGSTPASIAGTLDLEYVNATGADQSTVYLRLYPNSAIYPAGGMEIADLVVDGQRMPATLSVQRTVLAAPLPSPLSPGGSADLQLSFTTTIPTNPSGTYGMFEYDSETQVYTLANWFPILAGYDPATGWLIDPPAVIGDPVFANASLFDALLTTPREMVVAAGGAATETHPEAGRATHHLVTGPARDLVLAISPRFQSQSQAVGETTVTSYFLPEHADVGAATLVFGARALEQYGEWFGVYPYRQFALVETPLSPGAKGVEFPQLVFLNSGMYQSADASNRQQLDYVAAHEVAHQWFYGLVGNDQYEHAFLDEGLATTVALLEIAVAGNPSAATIESAFVIKPYQNFLQTHGDLVVDAPSESSPSSLTYNAIVYGKAVFGFDAIRAAIGPDAFDAALRLYVTKFRFRVAQPGDLLACFNEASGVDVTRIWTRWFDEAVESVGTLPTPIPVGTAA